VHKAAKGDAAVVPALILLAAAVEPPAVAPVDYTLPPPPPASLTGADCARPAGEIVVCGRRTQPDRLEELGPPPGGPPREGVIGVETPLGRVEPELMTVVRPDGWIDKRAMIKLRIPF
jgi:hypothetical protein